MLIVSENLRLRPVVNIAILSDRVESLLILTGPTIQWNINLSLNMPEPEHWQPSLSYRKCENSICDKDFGDCRILYCVLELRQFRTHPVVGFIIRQNSWFRVTQYVLKIKYFQQEKISFSFTTQTLPLTEQQLTANWSGLHSGTP